MFYHDVENLKLILSAKEGDHNSLNDQKSNATGAKEASPDVSLHLPKSQSDRHYPLSSKEAVTQESLTPEPADQAISAKLPEKLEDSSITIPKVSASGFSSDESAFQAVSTSTHLVEKSQ